MNDPLKKKLLALLQAPTYQPLTKSGLARALEVPSDQRSTLRQLLRELEAEGKIVSQRKGAYSLVGNQAGTMIGEYRVSPRGEAFFVPHRHTGTNRSTLLSLGLDPGRDQRLFIPEFARGTALPGDTVVARGQRDRYDREKIEARIEHITQRGSRPVLGQVLSLGSYGLVTINEPGWPNLIEVATDEKSTRTKIGHRVLVKLESWDNRMKRPRGTLFKDLGPADAPGQDMLTIIHKYNLPERFPAAVTREAEKISPDIPADEIARREDWREREVITIDPTDARDFDDAIAVTPLPKGGWELAVHIADVSYYVPPGSAIDREAQERGNSTYLADRVIPMIPEKLSNGLCSLQPHVDRLTRVCVMTFDSKGKRTGYRLARAVINSQRRFTYEEAYQAMKSNDPSKRHPVLDRAWPLASLLRKRRFQNGSLDLDFPEVRVRLDDQGRPLELTTTHNDESHQLIEEFMLAANEAVAHFIRSAATPGIYRVHEDPDEERLEELQMLLESFGLRPGDLTQRAELQRVLKESRGRADESAIKLAVLKSMKRACYLAEANGHYGLAKRDYTHFTSPIRRYADLIVHRVVGGLLAKSGHAAEALEKLPRQSEIESIAEHLSQTERTSAEAEQESQKLAQCLYFENLLKRRTPLLMDAAVNEVRRNGVFIQLCEHPLRGFIRRDDLTTHDWEYDSFSARFYCRRPKLQLKVGTRLQVVTARVDRVRRLIDFRMIDFITENTP